MLDRFDPTLNQIETTLTTLLKQEQARATLKSAQISPRVEDAHSEQLWWAIAYALQAGGKRLRPLLTVLTCQACGADSSIALPTACAIELLHTQSLIHDDLPCMDNDDLRRGKPTLHKATTEATAVLAGDAMLAMAFGWIVRFTPRTVLPEVLVQLTDELSDVASLQGLVNGQYADICAEGQPYTAEALRYIHTYKTAALFKFTVRAGALLAQAPENVLAALTAYGEHLGLAFQVVDDLLDETSCSSVLGKTAGKDKQQQKATYPALYGAEGAKKEAEAHIYEAKHAINTLGPKYTLEPLLAMADIVLTRIY
ncbi:MAG: farnesyl diphosphate synthase [Vampirovibrionales bacterium]|nr:farnesyl diphosphate synthase [Vampirovibrionales bacterium]